MKAIIAINRKTGEILSGQSENLESFDYYILKFCDKSMPVSEIEQLFRRMVFNVMTNNTDDHNKNFSFMLKQGGHNPLHTEIAMLDIYNLPSEKKLSLIENLLPLESADSCGG